MHNTANAERIRASGLFDGAWYLSRYPDVELLGMDPVDHFLEFGARLGRDPSPLFHTNGYLEAHPHLRDSMENPLLHFIRQEGLLRDRAVLGEGADVSGRFRRQSGNDLMCLEPAGSISPCKSSAKPAHRPLVWAYRPGAVKSGTIMRGEQLAQIAKKGLGETRSIHYLPLPQVMEQTNSVVILTTSALSGITSAEIWSMRRRGHIVCADYLDHSPNYEIHGAVNVYIASSLKQRDHFSFWFPDKAVFLITHHVDPSIPENCAASGRFRIGYFGELGNARHRDRLSTKIEFLQTNNSEVSNRDWLLRLSEFSFHYSVREYRFPSPNPRGDAFKPFTKGFTAARCGANILVPQGESDALYYLGPDYPYLLKDDSLNAVEIMIEYAEESFGSREWREALDVMRFVKAASSEESVVQEVRQMLDALA